MFEDQNVADIVCDKLGLEKRQPDLEEWRTMVDNIKASKDHVRIALVGKYVQLHDAYLSVSEALNHAGFKNHVHVDIAGSIRKRSIRKRSTRCSKTWMALFCLAALAAGASRE